MQEVIRAVVVVAETCGATAWPMIDKTPPHCRLSLMPSAESRKPIHRRESEYCKSWHLQISLQ